MDTRVRNIIRTLQKLYPNPKPSLDFKSPFELLIATILSAQCTDERVNKVTPALFKVASTPEKLLRLGREKLKRCIHSTGFYNAKSKSLIGAARRLVQKFAGTVPSSLDDLQTLPGVGRKTASVVLAQAFGIPTFPVDRHVFRVSTRLALARAKTADKTDIELRKKIPKKYWIPLHLQLIYHGRTVCRPKPLCHKCALLNYCPEGKRLRAARPT